MWENKATQGDVTLHHLSRAHMLLQVSIKSSQGWTPVRTQYAVQIGFAGGNKGIIITTPVFCCRTLLFVTLVFDHVIRRGKMESFTELTE